MVFFSHLLPFRFIFRLSERIESISVILIVIFPKKSCVWVCGVCVFFKYFFRLFCTYFIFVVYSFRIPNLELLKWIKLILRFMIRMMCVYVCTDQHHYGKWKMIFKISSRDGDILDVDSARHEYSEWLNLFVFLFDENKKHLILIPIDTCQCLCVYG